MGAHSLSYRTDWLMLTKLCRDEVIMALYMPLGFSARSDKRRIQDGAKIGQWEAPSPKDFFFRSECNSNKPNASFYLELKYRDCLLFRLISQIWKSCFLINYLLRNLNFNRSAHCTQVSDQCPLGLLLSSDLDLDVWPTYQKPFYPGDSFVQLFSLCFSVL